MQFKNCHVGACSGIFPKRITAFPSFLKQMCSLLSHVHYSVSDDPEIESTLHGTSSERGTPHL